MLSREELEASKGFAWKNRRRTARLDQWPDGALEACEELELAYQEFSPLYSNHAGRTPGFYAYIVPRTGGEYPRWLYGETAEDLREAMERERAERAAKNRPFSPLPTKRNPR